MKNSCLGSLRKFKRSETKWIGIILLIFFFGCKQTANKTENAYFLENIMIREGGLYVLMGSKPMCEFPIKNYPENESEFKLEYEKYLSENKNKKIMTYEQFRIYEEKKPLFLKDGDLWKHWQKKMNSLLGPRYRFFVRKNPYGARHQEGLFINIPNFLFVLKAHYTDFAKIGGEFDYEQVLNEFENEDSLFWDKVCKSDFLMGLLFGYGAKNAFAFVWRSKYNLQLPIIFGKHQGWDPVYQQNISIKDLPLPRLCAYSLGDETIEKYLKERKQIIKAFKGRSFEETVYEWLSAGR